VTSEPTSRDERLAQALRANLHRRKAQSRARRGVGPQGVSGSPAADRIAMDAPPDAARLSGTDRSPGSENAAAADGDDHG